MKRLDTLTQTRIPFVGMTYDEWCSTYISATGIRADRNSMDARAAARRGLNTQWSEENTARDGMQGWGWSSVLNWRSGGSIGAETSSAQKTANKRRKHE